MSLIKFFKFVVLSIIVIHLMGCLSKEEKFEKHLKRADKYIKKQELKAALIEFKSAIKILPSSSKGHVKLAEFYLKVGNFSGAVNEFRKALDLEPNNDKVRITLSNLYLMAKKTDLASKVLEPIFKKDSKEVLFTHAKILFAQGRGNEGEKEVIKVIHLAPDYGPSYLLLARYYLKKKKIKECEEVLKKGANSSEDSSIILALAEFYRVTNKPLKAESYYKRAIEKKPDSLSLKVALVRFYIYNKEIDKAEKLLQEMINSSNRDSDVLTVAGEFYVRLGKIKNAISLYKEAVSLLKGKDKAYVKLKLADLYLKGRDKDKASALVKDVLRTNPQNTYGIYLNARIELLNNKVESAIDNLRKIVKEMPNFSGGYYFLAEAYMRKRSYKLAEKNYQKALELNSYLYQAHVGLGKIYIVARKLDLAVEHLNAALKIKPNLFVAHLLAGDVCVLAKKLEAAEIHFKKMVELEPKNFLGYSRLGMLKLVEKNNKEASFYLKRALELNPDAKGTFLNYVNSYKKPEKAILFCRQHMKKCKDKAFIYMVIGKIYLKENDIKKAKDSFKEAIKLNPNIIGAYVSLADIYLKQDKIDRAIKEYKKVIKITPNYLPTYMVVAILYQLKGQISTANDYYKKALEINPRFVPAANNLAWNYAEQNKNINEALRLAQIAQEQDPYNPAINDTLGWIYYKKGLYLNAIAMLQESLERMPNQGVVIYHLAMAYLKSGKKEVARKYFKDALNVEIAESYKIKIKEILNQLKGKN